MMFWFNRRSIYNRYVDPTGGRQNQQENNNQAGQMLPPAAPVLQNNNQKNNVDTTNVKVEDSGGAKHIDPKLIEMITSEVRSVFEFCC